MKYITDYKMIRKSIFNRCSKADIEAMEELGFEFMNIGFDRANITMKAPVGWIIKQFGPTSCIEVIDKHGNVRVIVDNFKINLLCKYRAGYDYINDDLTKKEYYFGNKNEKIFVVGKVVQVPRENADYELLMRRYQLQEEYQMMVEAFAKEYYPDYQNPLTYWDDEKNKVKKNS